MVRGVENEREKISWSPPIRSSSSGMHGVPRSSRTVRISTTEKRSRTITGSARLRSRIVQIPMAFSRFGQPGRDAPDLETGSRAMSSSRA